MQQKSLRFWMFSQIKCFQNNTVLTLQSKWPQVSKTHKEWPLISETTLSTVSQRLILTTEHQRHAFAWRLGWWQQDMTALTFWISAWCVLSIHQVNLSRWRVVELANVIFTIVDYQINSRPYRTWEGAVPSFWFLWKLWIFWERFWLRWSSKTSVKTLSTNKPTTTSSSNWWGCEHCTRPSGRFERNSNFWPRYEDW